MDQKENKQFRYSGRAEETAFPLDFSLQAWCRKYGYNAKTVDKYIKSLPVLDRFFYRTRYLLSSSIPRKQSSRFDGIPVELDTFFSEYMDIVLEWQKKRNGHKSNLNSTDGDRELDQLLCSHFLDQAHKPENRDTYLSRLLYFNHSVIELEEDRFWTLFHQRIEAFEQLARQKKPEIQMRHITYMLRLMDGIIANLTSIPKEEGAANADRSENQMPFLSAFPWEIMRFSRNPLPDDDDKHDFAQFMLPELKIQLEHNGDEPENISLQEAFDRIPIERDLLEPIRKAYLADLNSRAEKSEFQKYCEDLAEFIIDFQEDISESDMKEDIHNLTYFYFKNLMNYFMGLEPEKKTDFPCSEHCIVLCDMVYSWYTQFQMSYSFAAQYMNRNTDQYGAFSYILQTAVASHHAHQAEQDGQTKKEDLYQFLYEEYKKQISYIWETETLGNITEACENIKKKYFGNIPDILRKSAEKLNETFDLEVIPLDQNTDSISACLETFRIILTEPVPAEPTPDRFYAMQYLFRLLFACRIMGEYERIQVKALEYYKYMSSYMRGLPQPPEKQNFLKRLKLWIQGEQNTGE